MKNQQTKKIKKTVLGILGFSVLTLGLGLGANSAVFATLGKTELIDRNIVLSGIVKEKSEQDSGVESSENTVGDENSEGKNSDGGNSKNATSEEGVLEGEVSEGELEGTDANEGELDEKEISEVPVLGQVGQTLKDFWWILAILGGLISFLLVFLFIKKKGKRNIHHLQ
ncbi:hypothetical protein HG471_001000 [Candidatus Saccharibacteria bacterium]|nr:hypothetical protein [Candidatus Saccharibacteria bacterium]TWO99161.1 hypothetical protein EUA79_01375 [TM7 phylum sp. oral taxon 351]